MSDGYTGKLHKGTEPDTVRGWIVDVMGTRIEFCGCRDPRGNGYLLVGRAILPPHLHIEGLDNGTEPPK